MAIFPKIQSPCPYKSDFAAIMDGDMCRVCKREVVDLNAMTDEERVALIAGCETEICVSYTFPAGAVMAATLAAAALGAPAIAAAQSAEDVAIWDSVVVGGIKDPGNAKFVSTDDSALPELAVVYEVEAPASAVEKTVTPAAEKPVDTAAASPADSRAAS